MRFRFRRILLALVVASVVAGSAVAFVSFTPLPTFTNVQEPISITPASQSLSIFAGECINIVYTVQNAGSATIILDAEAFVAAVPTGGSRADIVLTPASQTLSATPGNTALTVQACATNGAVPGTYVVVENVARS